MKKVKSIFFATALLVSSSFMQSCLDDNDNVPDFIELGTVIATSNGGSTEPIVEGDVYGKSYITNKNVLKDQEVDVEGQRILYRFIESKTNGTTDTNDDTKKQSISIFELYKVLTKPMDILAEDGDDVYGDDPINILGAYASAEHLNIQYQLLMGDPDIKHRISLVGAPDTTPDAEGYITVDFRHNAEGDNGGVMRWAYVSYTLESLPGYKEGKLKGLNIRFNSIYGGTSTHKVAIKNLTTSSASALGAQMGAPSTKTK
ncbi:NigD1/NigD2 family lipoprotein [Phocaeicola sp.]